MSQEITQFEKKILDLLKGHYSQQFAVGNLSKTETKRLSKAKADIISKVTNSMDAFVLLSEIIKISNITPKKSTDDSSKYIREEYTQISPEIVRSTLAFDLIGEQDILQHFKALQREIASGIFDLNTMKRLLDAIFAFHPQGITRRNIGGHDTYENTEELYDSRYQDPHKKYYRDMAGMLVESGINEIKKNLHPKRDAALIQNLEFTVNMIKRLDYHVEES